MSACVYSISVRLRELCAFVLACGRRCFVALDPGDSASTSIDGGLHGASAHLSSDVAGTQLPELTPHQALVSTRSIAPMISVVMAASGVTSDIRAVTALTLVRVFSAESLTHGT